MSKSYNNTIPIFGNHDSINNQVMNIVTDSAGLNDIKDTNTPLFKIYSLFLDDKSKKELHERYNTPGLKYMEVKKELVDVIINYFAHQRKRRDELIANEDKVNDLMNLGKTKAQKIARETLSHVKQAVGLL